MPKIMTQTNIWQKAWFRNLSISDKLLLKYLWERSSHAGIIDLDQDLFEFELGTPLDLNTSLDNLSKHIERLPNGKLFLIDRVRVNQGELSPKCKAHIPIIEELKKYNLYDRVVKGLANPYERVSKPLAKGTSNSNSNSNSNKEKPKTDLSEPSVVDNPKLDVWKMVRPIFGLKDDAYYSPDIQKAIENLLAKYELPQIKRGVKGRRLAENLAKDDKEVTAFLRWGIGKYIDTKTAPKTKADTVELYCVHCDTKKTVKGTNTDPTICCEDIMLTKNDYTHEKTRIIGESRNGSESNGGGQGSGLQARDIRKSKSQRSGNVGINEIIGTLTKEMETV